MAVLQGVGRTLILYFWKRVWKPWSPIECERCFSCFSGVPPQLFPKAWVNSSILNRSNKHNTSISFCRSLSLGGRWAEPSAPGQAGAEPVRCAGAGRTTRLFYRLHVSVTSHSFQWGLFFVIAPEVCWQCVARVEPWLGRRGWAGQTREFPSETVPSRNSRALQLSVQSLRTALTSSYAKLLNEASSSTASHAWARHHTTGWGSLRPFPFLPFISLNWKRHSCQQQGLQMKGQCIKTAHNCQSLSFWH